MKTKRVRRLFVLSSVMVLVLMVIFIPTVTAAQAFDSPPGGVRYIAAGGNNSAAIKQDGSLWVWGCNWYGQFGNHTTGQIPGDSMTVRVGTDNDWASVSVGSHVLAVKTDGSLWAWGNNEHGQLGDGTNENRRIPVRVGSDYDWLKVFVAGNRDVFSSGHSIAIRTDGSLWAWGLNSSGQLGNGTYVNSNVPVRIGTSYDWAFAAPGSAYTMAGKNDGSLWGWGNDTWNHPEDINIPTRIGTSYEWADIATRQGRLWTSFTTTLAVKNDGSLWAWGDSIFLSNPVRVGSRL